MVSFFIRENKKAALDDESGFKYRKRNWILERYTKCDVQEAHANSRPRACDLDARG